jgi:RimJ/RimL family protein N-acetyltransferase
MPGPVFLKGDHVTLRAIEEEDLEFLQEAITDPQVRRSIGGSTPYNLEQEREFFENVISDNETVQLLISNEETPIGMIGLEPINQEAGVTEVGYWIVPEYWGEGFGTEATELIVEYAFNRLRLHKVTARAFGFNDASQRLFRKSWLHRRGGTARADIHRRRVPGHPLVRTHRLRVA